MRLLRIHNDVWRKDMIATLGFDGQCTINVLPVHGTVRVDYIFDTHEKARSEYVRIVAEWQAYVETMKKA